MNSAVMTSPGRYLLNEISKREFIERLINAYDHRILVNRISYKQNADLIYEWTDGEYRPVLNRQSTFVEDGDEMLCMTLKYRVEGYEGKQVNENDFQFFHCVYSL